MITSDSRRPLGFFPTLWPSLSYFVECSNSTPVRHLRMTVTALGFIEISALRYKKNVSRGD